MDGGKNWRECRGRAPLSEKVNQGWHRTAITFAEARSNRAKPHKSRSGVLIQGHFLTKHLFYTKFLFNLLGNSFVVACFGCVVSGYRALNKQKA